MYKCTNCKRVVENFEGLLRCSYCGARVFAKIRPNVVKKIQAR